MTFAIAARQSFEWFGSAHMRAAGPSRVAEGDGAFLGRQVLFIQGGGAGVHDQWDSKLAASLERALGAGYDVRYPHMPGEDDPSYARWSAAIRREMTELDDGAVIVGHLTCV